MARIAALTGASGHIGANLLRLLLQKGFSVRVLAHKDTKAIEGLDVEVVQGSVLDQDALKRLVQGADLVFHAAGRVSLKWHDPLTVRINVEGTRKIISACLSQDCGRLIHFGSIHSFEEGEEELSEASPLALNNVPDYNRSKALSVAIVRRAVVQGLDAVVVCPTAVIGPHDYRPSALGRVILRVANSRLPVAVSGGYNFVDVRDVALGSFAAATKGTRGHTYILSGEWRTLKDLFSLVAKEAGSRPPLLYLPTSLAYAGVPFAWLWAKLTGSEPPLTRLSVSTLKMGRRINGSKARRDLGFSPRSLEDTVAATIRWFREYGYLGGT